MLCKLQSIDLRIISFGNTNQTKLELREEKWMKPGVDCIISSLQELISS